MYFCPAQCRAALTKWNSGMGRNTATRPFLRTGSQHGLESMKLWDCICPESMSSCPQILTCFRYPLMYINSRVYACKLKALTWFALCKKLLLGIEQCEKVETFPYILSADSGRTACLDNLCTMQGVMLWLTAKHLACMMYIP